MGDRTWANLTFPTELADTVCKITNNKVENITDLCDILSQISYDGVNYGNMDESEKKKLIAAGVPFDWEWGDGGEYSAGYIYNRYTEKGELFELELYDNNVNPDLDELMKRIDQPEVLVAFIVEHHKAIQVPSWDNQVEYGKRYRMRQLVAPT